MTYQLKKLEIIIFAISITLINILAVTTNGLSYVYISTIAIGILALIIGLIMSKKNIYSAWYALLFSCVYLLISPSVLILMSSLNSIYSIKDPETARIFMSTLVLGEAAIFAIIVSSSLIAMQIASDSYSHRIIKVFAGSLEFWFINFIYTVSIILGFGVLMLIGSKGIDSNSLEIYLINLYFLGLFDIMSLIIYLKRIFYFLDPSNIISDLTKKMSTISSFSSIEPGGKNDLVQPIIDVIIKALMGHEEKIALDGIEGIKIEFVKLIKGVKSELETDLAGIISYHFTKLGIMAISDKQSLPVESIISNLQDLALSSINEARWDMPARLIISLETIGLKALEQNLGTLVYKIIASIGAIGVKASEHGLRCGAHQAATSLGNIAIIAIEKDMPDAYYASILLGNIGVNAIDKQWEDITKESLTSLGDIALKAVQRNDIGASKEAILNIKEIGIRVKKSKLIDIVNLIKSLLVSIKETAITLKLNDIVQRCDDVTRDLESDQE